MTKKGVAMDNDSDAVVEETVVEISEEKKELIAGFKLMLQSVWDAKGEVAVSTLEDRKITKEQLIGVVLNVISAAGYTTLTSEEQRAIAEETFPADSYQY